jgi:hypothetical protein
MADKTAKQARLLGKRVQALAIMYLTRRSDLSVEEVRGEDTGLDLMVRFTSGGKDGVRQFGVQLRGVWSPVTKEDADKLAGRSLREAQRYGPFALPVCLFLFAMEANHGWHTWVAEPVVEAGTAHLRLPSNADCQPLDRAALDEVVARVDRWYDAFFANLIAN